MKEDQSAEIALVTGASRGIGKAIAIALGQQGATVIGTATSAKGAESISEYLRSKNLAGAGKVLDVCDPTSIEQLMNDIKAEFAAPSILVNNAGITRDGLLMRMKEDDWQAIMETNLSSIYRLSKACLKAMMKARRGRIVNIASVVGFSGNAGQTNYAAAKAGMLGFSRSLAQEIGSRGITVNVVAPGFIDTDMTKALSAAQKETLLGNIPLKRLGDPEDIAQAVAFLVSPGASYITGSTLHVNGGMYMA